MKVLFVTTSYPSIADDWKGIFMRDMLTALDRQPNLSVYYWGPTGPLPDGVINVTHNNEAIWLNQLLASGGIAKVLRLRPVRSLFIAARLLYYLRRLYHREQAVDVVHVNWLQNALPLYGLKMPALITVLGSDLALSAKPSIRFLMHKMLKQQRAIVVPNADWMADKLREELPVSALVKSVCFGVDDRWFDVERAFDPMASKMWLTVLRVTPKKIGQLFQWGLHLANAGDELHLFGPMQESVTIPSWVHYHGPTYPDELRVDWYPKAAGLITLSQHDEGRPQVILEAMAAGLPVIASNQPAHQDVITHGKTGCIVEGEQDFLSACNILSNSDLNRQMGRDARNWIRTEIGTWDDCAGRYHHLYDSIRKSD